MKLSIASKDLTAGILSVTKALPVRTPMQVLEGIQMVAKENSVTLKCSDLLIEKEYTLFANVEEDGECIVPAKVFTDISRRLPDSEAYLESNSKTLTLNCSSVHLSLQTYNDEEFPVMRFDGESYSISTDAAELKSMIQQTAFAAALEDTKPILTGVFLEIAADTLSAVATDAYQFAIRKMSLGQQYAENKAIVPAKSLNEIAHMVDEGTGDVRLTFTRTHVRAEMENVCLTARLLEGEYIPYKRLIPSDCKARALIKKDELIAAIDRAQLMARTGNNNIVLHFSENKVEVSANSFAGKVQETVPVQLLGEDIEIAFNPKYCMNVLKNVDDESLYFEMQNAYSPCVVRPVQGERFYYLMVPVRNVAQY